LLAPAVASAEKVDCPRVEKPRPKRPKKPVAPRPKKDEVPCLCKGEKGDTGPQGPQGVRGETGSLVIENLTVIDQRPHRIDLRFGVMGTVQGPYGDWAWGPALQLEQSLSSRYDLIVTGGVAAGSSDDRQSGYMLQLEISREVAGQKDGNGIAFSLGVNSTRIRGSSENGNVSGDYLSAVGGITVHSRHVRVEIGPTMGGLRDDSSVGTELAFGLQGSAFVGWGW
jgi:hypothetical protein